MAFVSIRTFVSRVPVALTGILHSITNQWHVLSGYHSLNFCPPPQYDNSSQTSLENESANEILRETVESLTAQIGYCPQSGRVALL